jgi:hypothetical protein
MIAAQYAPPPSDTTAADVVYARINRPSKPAVSTESADDNSLSTGVPRGAHLYSQVGDKHDLLRSFSARPPMRMEPPKRARVEPLGPQANRAPP